MRQPPGRVENYTNPFLVTAGLILFMGFFTMAATVGVVWVMLSAALIDCAIKVGAARSSTREVRQDP